MIFCRQNRSGILAIFPSVVIKNNVKLFSDIDAVYEENYQLPNTLPELIQKISENVDSVKPKSLIYCNTIDDTIECAKKMADHLWLTPSKVLNDAADDGIKPTGLFFDCKKSFNSVMFASYEIDIISPEKAGNYIISNDAVYDLDMKLVYDTVGEKKSSI